MGPTLVSYLRGVGAGAARTVVATTATIATGMAGALWLVAAAAVGGCAAAAAVVGGGVAGVVLGPGLGPPTRGGEEWLTRGLKLCLPRVLTMPRLEKGRRWREWKDEDLFAKEEKGF